MIQKLQPVQISVFLFCCMVLTSCSSEKWEYRIVVNNPGDMSRKQETLEIDLSLFSAKVRKNAANILIEDKTKNIFLTQIIDVNQDSVPDYLLFQADFSAGETREFTLKTAIQTKSLSENTLTTYCRFVPERMDDFAWENDKVAFRTYGPECQRMFEEGIPGGLISSGIDCWLKRVSYPIIDKWYKKEQSGGSYHKDDGDGLDNYQVGTSRGCGGTALPERDGYILSKNFARYNIVANGPVRSIFELSYDPYMVGSFYVNEIKRFSIDLGSRFYRCDVHYICDSTLQQAAVGIAHHNSDGKVKFNPKNSNMLYWEKLDDSYLGTAVIADDVSGLSHRTDSENHWMVFSVENNSFSFWAGFVWEKAGEISSSEEWDKYARNQFRKYKNKLQIEIVKN